MRAAIYLRVMTSGGVSTTRATSSPPHVLADAWCARRDPPGEPACEVRVRDAPRARVGGSSGPTRMSCHSATANQVRRQSAEAFMTTPPATLGAFSWNASRPYRHWSSGAARHHRAASSASPATTDSIALSMLSKLRARAWC
jgi:hypothetical protein